MTKQEQITAERPAKPAAKATGLALLREPFPANQISKLPKPTKRQTDEVRNDFKKGVRCNVCGGWHHPNVVHLDYVGHAALTDRLLDCDPAWNWEPVNANEQGAPVMDANGGMWIRLTVSGLSRLGYGHADGKQGGDAIKEVIGDALRNAAMRFGAALDLWHKGDLHGLEDGDPEADERPTEPDEGSKQEPSPPPTGEQIMKAIEWLFNAADEETLSRRWDTCITRGISTNPAAIKARDARKAELEKPADNGASVALDDEIPY